METTTAVTTATKIHKSVKTTVSHVLLVIYMHATKCSS